MDEGDDEGLFAALHSYLLYIARVGIYHEWHALISWVKSKLPASGRSHLAEFSQAQVVETISEAKENEKLAGRKDFVAKLLRMHWDDPAAFPMAKVYATAITNVGAGSDTTSVSLSSIMYCLMRRPDCYQKV